MRIAIRLEFSSRYLRRVEPFLAAVTVLLVGTFLGSSTVGSAALGAMCLGAGFSEAVEAAGFAGALGS